MVERGDWMQGVEDDGAVGIEDVGGMAWLDRFGWASHPLPHGVSKLSQQRREQLKKKTQFFIHKTLYYKRGRKVVYIDVLHLLF